MRRVPVCTALALLLTSCASSSGSGDTWVYGISRDFYSSAFDNPHKGFSDGERPDEGSAMAFALLLVLPFAVDTLLLPVTVPHDLLFVE